MLTRQSFTAISSQLWTDVTTSLNQPVSRYSILGSLIRALSRAVFNGYCYTDTAFLNAVPYLATGTHLEAWAALWGVYRKAASSANNGTATFLVNGAATIPAGSVFTGSNSIQYYTLSDNTATIAGTLQVSTLSTNATGSITNLSSGSSITLTNVIPNVVSYGTVISIAGGTDAEVDKALFIRAQEVRSNPPAGGAPSDYIEWATACPNVGVTRAWTQVWGAGYGTVIVYICIDDALHTNGFPNGTNGTSILETRSSPATGDQLQVANYIYQPGRRPVTALVYVYTPIAQPINITIQSANPSSVATKALVSSALIARFIQIGTPLGMTLYESDINKTLDGILTSYNLSIPSGSVSIAVGSLPVLGTITWI